MNIPHADFKTTPTKKDKTIKDRLRRLKEAEELKQLRRALEQRDAEIERMIVAKVAQPVVFCTDY